MHEQYLVEDEKRAAENRARIAKEQESADKRWDEMNKLKYKVPSAQCRRRK